MGQHNITHFVFFAGRSVAIKAPKIFIPVISFEKDIEQPTQQNDENRRLRLLRGHGHGHSRGQPPRGSHRRPGERCPA